MNYRKSLSKNIMAKVFVGVLNKTFSNPLLLELAVKKTGLSKLKEKFLLH